MRSRPAVWTTGVALLAWGCAARMGFDDREPPMDPPAGDSGAEACAGGVHAPLAEPAADGAWPGMPCDGPDQDLCREGVLVACGPGRLACADATGDSVELCDGSDNDCDPASADGAGDPRLGQPCDGSDVDLCLEGTFTECSGGRLACSDSSGDDRDVCDGADNDCDPTTADGAGDPDFGVPCDGPDSDLCREGAHAVCTDGTLLCSDTTDDSLDLCDRLDNDCDPASADGAEDPALGGPCDGPDDDLCLEGVVTACLFGTLACSDSSGDAPEVCDGADNDCDPASADGAEDPGLGSPCDGPDADPCADDANVACTDGGLSCSAGPAGCDATALPPFGPPVLLAELNTPSGEDDPTLTGDLLEILFDSNRPGGLGGGDLWRATRASSSAPFGPPVNVTELNSTGSETTPEITPDGLTLFFGSDRPGGAGSHDLYVSTRASRSAPWAAPARVAELATSSADYAAAPAGDAALRVVYASSRAGGAGGVDLYEAARTLSTDPFGPPVSLGPLNAGSEETSPWIDPTATALYFSSDRSGADDLFVTTRVGPGAPFAAPAPVDELNSADRDQDPWLSPDLRVIVFSRTIGGQSELLMAWR
ncbi:MAG: PD40 domain-containing protein [Deltaproteobacteria bacterium]|nr:PD40 domain-containing protein [Deltaproteobacteria bacterium]